MNITAKRILVGLFVMTIVWAANADTTFRAHFNDTGSWNINTVNGDYSSGSGTATVSGAPMWGTGFFPGSSPANKAFYVTNATPKISFPGNDGNVPISNPTSSVMTVSFWMKITGNERCRPIIIRNQGFTDYLMMDYGHNSAGNWTMIFHDDGVSQGYKTFTTDVSSYITNWLYISATINLADKTIRVLNYDNAGNLVANQTISMLVDSWDITNGASIVQFNYSQIGTNQIWVDEFTIDDRKLSQSEMRVRVNKMVSGTQLSDDDSLGPAAPGVPPGPTNITFLAHFNDNANRGWDLNTDNGDFYGGSSIASWIGNPGWTTGFFTAPDASTPANRALYTTNSGDMVIYNGYDGNINYDSYTSGGMTVGFWAKVNFSGSGYFAAGLANIGLGGVLDHLSFDYSYGKGNQIRGIYWEGDTNRVDIYLPDSSAYITNWVFIAAVVDLSGKTMTMYQYDNAGNSIGSPVSAAIPVTSWNIKDDSASRIKIGGTLYSPAVTLEEDEFTIFNYALTQSEIEKLVQKMVNGKEINYQPPAGMFMVIK